MINTPQTISQAYDITAAFITDKETELRSHSDQWCVEYIFCKENVCDKDYYLRFFIPRDIYPNKNKYGIISLYHIENGQPINLFRVQTKCKVASILHNSTHPTKSYNIKILAEKCLSYKFYKLLKLIELRTSAQIKRQDNTYIISQNICRITETQR